ncbi:universal stress protein [Nonomuraea sp. NPDC050328]
MRAATELLHAAAEHDADLVLIGCGGWPPELGRAAETLMRCAPCPVMVVQ